jgi:type I restriction enzyme S subunit
MAGNRKVWIEVITPKPEGIDPKWLQRNCKEALSLPHEAVLLRWCAAIKEKAEKLLGNDAKGLKRYLQKGIVSPDDSYVIAVNGYLLRHPPFPQLLGISQFPFAVEATFCVGPIQVFLDLDTRKVVGQEHQQRVVIPKPNGAQVPADTFFDPRFSAISAIWAVDVDENLLLDRPCPMAVVHNPIAVNPIASRLLPAQTEYAAEVRPDSYLLTRRPGRLPDIGVLA